MICWSFSFTAVDRCCFLCCKSVLCSDSEPPITTFTTQFDNHHQLSRGFVFIAGQLLWWWITWVGIYLSICGSCPRYLVRDREHHNWGTSPSILWQKIGSRGGGIFIIGLDFLIRIVSLVQHRLLRLDCGPWKGNIQHKRWMCHKSPQQTLIRILNSGHL